jgi:hypothetical protein
MLLAYSIFSFLDLFLIYPAVTIPFKTQLGTGVLLNLLHTTWCDFLLPWSM